MANQTTVRGNSLTVGRGGAFSPGPAAAASSATAENGSGSGGGPAAVVTNLAVFGENLLTLAELQSRLASLEVKQNVQAAKIGVPVMLGGAALSMASLPLILAGIAELLVSELGMKRGYALLSVAIVAFGVAGAGIAVAAAQLRRTAVGFPLSREELARNLNWVRTVLLHSGRAVSGRRS